MKEINNSQRDFFFGVFDMLYEKTQSLSWVKNLCLITTYPDTETLKGYLVSWGEQKSDSLCY